MRVFCLRYAKFSALMLVLITIGMSYQATAVSFSEIMYNPLNSDTGREWIELNVQDDCNPSSEWKLLEGNVNHNIYLYSNESYNESDNESSCRYIIICNDCGIFEQEYSAYKNATNATFKLFRSSFSLSNTGEHLAVKENDTIISEINYSQFVNPDNEGLSLQSINGSWIHNDPSPGNVNVLLLNNSYGNGTYINATSGNETYNDTTGNESDNATDDNETDILSGCSVTLSLELKNHSIFFKNKEQIRFYNRLIENPTDKDYSGDFSIEYWIEDLFGNTFKNRLNTSNDNEKSYTPSIDEKDKVLLIKNSVTDINCTPDDASLLNDEQMVVVSNEAYAVPSVSCPKSTCASSKSDCICPSCKIAEENKSSQSNISIKKFEYSEKDQMLYLELYAYRGDTRKYSINIYLKKDKISEKHNIKIMKQYSEVYAEIPLHLSECNSTLFIEGLDINISQEIETCAERRAYDNESSLTYGKIVLGGSVLLENTSFLSHPHNDTGLIGYSVYESPNFKNKQYSLIGIVSLTLAGIAYLIRRILNPKDL